MQKVAFMVYSFIYFEIILILLAKVIKFYIQVSIIKIEFSGSKKFIEWYEVFLKLIMLLALD